MVQGRGLGPLLKGLRDRIPIQLGNYPYVTARVRAKKALLLPRDTYDRLLQMSVSEIARILGEGQYSDEMVALATRYSGVDLVEAATRNNLAKVFTQIIGFSEGPLKDMIARFLDRWDVWNIKTILRGKFYGATEEEIVEDVVPAGSFPQDFVHSLAAMEEIDEIVDALVDSIYRPVLVGLPASLQDARSLAAYEDLLDRVYYESLLASVPPAPEPQRLFHNFVRMEIDVVNTKTLLRVRGLEQLPDRHIFIQGGLNFTREQVREMVTLELPALLERLKKAPFYDALAPFLQNEEPQISQGIRAMEKWLMHQASRGANLHPLSVLPVLDYLVAKTVEVENIRIIARGKALGLESDVIREMLLV